MKYVINEWVLILASTCISYLIGLIGVFEAALIILIFLFGDVILFRKFIDLNKKKRSLRRVRTYTAYIMLTILSFNYSIIIFVIMILLIVVDLALFLTYKYFK